MPLSSGTRLGHYEILEKIGAGGMGEVYRARDTRLGRDVAVKVSAERFSERFEREARVIASLNHPNICTLFDVGPNYLVMELVEGPTLAERIKEGAIPLEEALGISRQIADALEAAHEKGVVHRDLKPGNVKIKPGGAVKVLDFGLAKVASASAGDSQAEASPTLTIGMTEAGMILGTAAYMAPEQARGIPVDKRADIWAFGVVLFEIVTGELLFKGQDVTETLASVVKDRPDFSRVPAEVRKLLERCLEKDQKKRLRDIGDAWALLEEPPGETEVLRPAEVRATKLPWAITAALMLALAAALFFLWPRTVERPLIRLSADLGPDAVTDGFITAAIAPDGNRIVFPMRGPGGKQQLATRLLAQTQPTLLPDTDNGSAPFFSPDGQWVGFFANGKLKKISVQGGAPIALCDAPNPRGGSWGDDGNIIAALNNVTGLSRVSAAGGTPQPLTKLTAAEVTHRWPQVLRGSQAVLFTASTNIDVYEEANIELLSLKTGERKTAQPGGYFGRYLPTQGSSGHLVYTHGGVVFGVVFDPARPERRGTSAPLLDDVGGDATYGVGQFDFAGAPSGPGTLVYLGGKGAATRGWPIVWLDSSGKTQPLLPAGLYYTPRFSPDGRRLALAENPAKGLDIFVYDWQRDTKTRLTFTAKENVYPVWTPDGKHIAFRTGSPTGIGWIRADGAGEMQRLLDTKGVVDPYSFSPDGRRLAYDELSPETGFDLYTLPLDLSDPDHPKPGKPEVFLRTPFAETEPAFSPDGRWIAYQSNESGAFEIYVRPFPGPGGKWQISMGGGRFPIWSRDNRNLFYETEDQHIMVVDYTAKGDSFAAGKPRLWSNKQIQALADVNLDLTPDGKRFAVTSRPDTGEEKQGSVHVTFLLNFFDEVRRRIPEGK